MSGKLPENNPWSNLSTVNTFDKGNHSWTTRCMDDSDVQGGGQIVGRVAPSTSLLIESLIQQLCTVFEGDAVRRNKLYFAICDRLHEMKLIDGSYSMLEFDNVRGQYQIALYKLVTVARASTGSESPLQVPNCLMAEWSRYRREFQEIAFIAEGGFGSVFKALHRLDGNEYAIKKIVVHSGRVKTIMQHLEEVKTIAKLNHTNIVSYKGAWIEPTFPETFVPNYETYKDFDNRDRESSGVSDSIVNGLTKSRYSRSNSRRSRRRNSESKSKESRYSESDCPGENKRPNESDKFTYKTGMYISIERETARRGSGGGYVISHDIINERFQQLNSTNNIIGERISETVSSRIVEEDYSDIVSFRSETQENKNYDTNENSNENTDVDEIPSSDDPQDGDSPEEAMSERRICTAQYAQSQRYATLYIQMALCDQTLRQWMDERIEPTPVQLVKAILMQILSGLEYIHSCGIVHHDIKPSNIFISASSNLQIQLGDFGLACPLQRESHPSMFGTPTYAAPEQLKGKCDPKSDVYSLGIVLLELLIPMQTQMERSRVIAALKSGQIPTTLTNNHPKWAQIISQLVQEDPQKRPSTAELLLNLREDKDSLIAKLIEENKEKDEIIFKLREENERKSNIIDENRMIAEELHSKNNMIVKLREENERKNTIIDETKRIVEELRNKVAQLESKVVKLELEISLDNT